jgi:hypothetical protein
MQPSSLILFRPRAPAAPPPAKTSPRSQIECCRPHPPPSNADAAHKLAFTRRTVDHERSRASHSSASPPEAPSPSPSEHSDESSTEDVDGRDRMLWQHPARATSPSPRLRAQMRLRGGAGANAAIVSQKPQLPCGNSSNARKYPRVAGYESSRLHH